MDIFERAKRNQLRGYIRKLGKLCGEEESFVEEYATDVIETWKNDLEKAIQCFKNQVYLKETYG